DPLPVALERVERSVRELPGEGQVAHALDLRTSWIRTSTLFTCRPVRRSTSYCTRLCSVDATSARLSPYSTTTLSSIVTPSSPLPRAGPPCRNGSRVSGRLREAMPITP